MTPAQQDKVQTCAKNFEAALDQETLGREVEIEKDMIAKGMDVYTPDLAAFVANVKKVYAEEGQDADWPAGMYDAIVNFK